jgi:hypothetical protein
MDHSPIALRGRPSTSPPPPPSPPPFERPLPTNRPAISENKICSNCKREQDISSFLSKTGRELKQCLGCRTRGTIRPRMDSTPVKSPSNKRSRIPVNRRRSPSILRRSPTYLRRGRNSQDNDVEAAARALRNQRQRSYRAAIRRGEQHSPIPSWNTTVANIVEQQGIRVGRGGAIIAHVARHNPNT